MPPIHEPPSAKRSPPGGRSARAASLLAIGLLAAPFPHRALAQGTRSTSPAQPSSPQSPNGGCCWDPDVVNYGRQLQFSDWGEGDEIYNQYRSLGVLFGRSVNPAAPATVIAFDPSRDSGCGYVLNGEPAFRGSVYFVFVDSTQNTWATVQRVGADIGYCDLIPSSFIAAYDADGNLLETKYSDRTGFQYLGIERPSADISRVLIGACAGAIGLCYPDPGGLAVSCLSFSTPVATAVPMPSTISIPSPPAIKGAPGASPVGLGVLGLALGLIAVWGLRRRVNGVRRA